MQYSSIKESKEQECGTELLHLIEPWKADGRSPDHKQSAFEVHWDREGSIAYCEISPDSSSMDLVLRFKLLCSALLLCILQRWTRMCLLSSVVYVFFSLGISCCCWMLHSNRFGHPFPVVLVALGTLHVCKPCAVNRNGSLRSLKSMNDVLIPASVE